jgi:hypothetical protein
VQDEKETKLGNMLIHVDCEKKLRVLDGTVGPDRLFTFVVSGSEGSSAEISPLSIDACWEPCWSEEGEDQNNGHDGDKGQDEDFELTMTPQKTIAAGNSATLRIREQNRRTIWVYCPIRCVCANGEWYIAEGTHSPPRIIIPPVRGPR